MEMYSLLVLIQHIDMIHKVALYFAIQGRDAGETFNLLIRKKEMCENDKL
jgi:hypothetical protein